MDPIHIQSADATAGVIAAELTRMGYLSTWGAEVSPYAGFVIIPHAPSGHAQADRLTADTVLAAVRNVYNLKTSSLRSTYFTVKTRSPAQAPPPPPAPVQTPPLSVRVPARENSTALCMMAYGQDSRRVTSVTRGLEGLKDLNPKPFILFAELVEPGSPAMYIPQWLKEREQSGEAQTIILPLTPANAGLWQKEPVHNILGETAADLGFDILIFHDPDCIPSHVDWCGRVSAYLRANPEHVLQPWSSYSDTVEPTHLNVSSYTRSMEEGHRDIRRAPGLAWAMTADTFRDVGGFNPYFAPGGGDTAWVFSISDNPGLSDQPLSWPWWREILHSQPKPHRPVHSIDCGMSHQWHGPFSERSYFWRNRALCDITDSVLSELSLGRNGLLKMRDTPVGRAIRHILLNKKRMPDEAGYRTVVQEALRIKETSA